MIVRQLFVGDDGRVRAFWRLVVFFAAMVVATLVAEVMLGPLISQFFSLVGIRGVTNSYWVQLLGIVGATAFVLRVVDKRPWADVWLGADAARPSLLILGFLIGLSAIAIPIGALIGVQWLRQATGGEGSWLGAAIRVSVMLLPAALFEELMTRGYVLSVLRQSWGWPLAIAATSIGFGLLHLQNNGATVGSVLLVVLAGVFLAGVLYATGSLYAAWMAHFAWNWTMAVVFHTAVSGYPLESPGYRYVDAGPDWATGGEWGPEGGVPAGLGMGAAASLAYLLARRARWRSTQPATVATLDGTAIPD